jgi:sucrose synthase
MHELFQAVLNSDEKTALRQLVFALNVSGKRYFLRNEILSAFADYCQDSQKAAYFYHSSSLGKLIHYTHEIIIEEENTWFLVRPKIASQEIWRLEANMTLESQEPKALLDVRDRFVNRYQANILEIDTHPFYEGSPNISDPRNIGQGLTFLNRYLCNQVLTDRQYWLDVLYDVLQKREYDGIPLLINDRIHSGSELSQQLKEGIKLVSSCHPDESYDKFHLDFQQIGFEPGWGNTASRVKETLELLERLFENPEPPILEAFVSRIPAIFRVVLVSIHGWVGQEDVLGRPETMGQVVYVLEQARSLENKLQAEIQLAGLDLLNIKPQVIILTRLIPNCQETQCDLRVEKLSGTENGWILRVPFGEFNPEVTQNWISKYEIWPYLETFANDAEKELLTKFNGTPNLIIGNYSDGNLVAFLLARRLKATHCHIAHSLEKPKHLFSNLYWQDLEKQYHFSAQYTADIISMNAADFIVTSSYQEIVGTPDSIGQYESYKCFTMPELYHVINGLDLFSPKFNMVAPGVNENIFFPYSQVEDRDQSVITRVKELLFDREDPHILGNLDDPNKRIILAVAPMTEVKNLAGLAECFGKSQELQARCNLIILTSNVHASATTNQAEAVEIEKLQEIIKQYNLNGKIRWLGMRLKSVDLAEAYRAIADRQGIFVHFAHFEAFGLTILEAMISGLPTFATQFGGAAEIVGDRDNEFQINPTDLEGTTARILNFIDQCETNPEYWHNISEWVIQRIRNNYNWHLHSNQLLLLAKIYTFWNFVSRENRESLLRYMETLFHLVYKPRAEAILDEHMHR